MRLRALGLLAVLCLSLPSAAAPRPDPLTSPRPLSSREDMREVVDALVERSFPELEGVKIKLREFESDDFFFRSRFTIGSFLFRGRLTYVLDINTRVYDLAPSRQAVVAILAHELSHTLHYQTHSRLRVVLDLGIFISKSAEARFERRTDLETIARGYARGLIAYREWVYDNIPTEDLAAKRRSYLGPGEIRLAQHVLREHMRLFGEWQDRPPPSLAEAGDSLREHLLVCEEHGSLTETLGHAAR